MPLVLINKITREDAEDNPEVLFLFTENEDQKGGSPLARELRHEDNGVGVRVKRSPSNHKLSFYNDYDFPEACNNIDEDMEKVVDHLNDGGVVIIPAGRFTNDEKLQEFSPDVYEYLIDKIAELGNL